MTIYRHVRNGEKGFAYFYMAVVMTGLLLFTGLAVDSGRAYLVKAQLSKAVDGAALGAARMLNSGDPKSEAATIFKANFPSGYLGTVPGDPTTSGSFFKLSTVSSTGLNVIDVSASATLPTTFMNLMHRDKVVVTASSEATRRMVDLSLVLDVSSSIGSQWGAVRDAARTFINGFDQTADRLALITFGNGANVLDQMPSGRGFDKNKVMADVPQGLPGGSTAMVEGFYRGWDELRAVPSGQQSGLRVIVLFTDGASNSVPGNYPAAPGLSKGLRTYDFPKVLPDPDGQTHDNPTIEGLFDAQTGVAQNPLWSLTVSNWNNTDHAVAGPSAAAHELPHASSQQRHSDRIPAADQRAQGERRHAVQRPGPAPHQRQRPVSGGSLQHQQRGQEPPRDHRGPGAQR